MKHLKISWKTINILCNDICKQIDSIDNLLLVSRGGLIPGRLIADYYNIRNLHFITVQSYKNKKANTPLISNSQIANIVVNKPLYVIDDICDSGLTFHHIKTYFKEYDIKTMSLFWRSTTSFIKPDYYGRELRNDNWLIFPWETKETKID